MTLRPNSSMIISATTHRFWWWEIACASIFFTKFICVDHCVLFTQFCPVYIFTVWRSIILIWYIVYYIYDSNDLCGATHNSGPYGPIIYTKAIKFLGMLRGRRQSVLVLQTVLSVYLLLGGVTGKPVLDNNRRWQFSWKHARLPPIWFSVDSI